VDLKTIFGTAVRNQRKARGLTQEALAERVELSIETIGKIERGVAAPSFETVENIAAALDVSPVALFGAGKQAVPPGERGKSLRKIDATLASMNDEQLSRVAKMLDAFMGR
jgi:transcriptional regulator with XRE-family HTH domain